MTGTPSGAVTAYAFRVSEYISDFCWIFSLISVNPPFSALVNDLANGNVCNKSQLSWFVKMK